MFTSFLFTGGRRCALHRRRRGSVPVAGWLATVGLLLGWLVVGGDACAEVVITGIVVDGRELPLPAQDGGRDSVPIRIPSTARQIVFRFAGAAEGKHDQHAPQPAGGPQLPAGTRLRFRLDGRDPAWRDVPASGRAVLHIVDADGILIGGLDAAMTGETPGWRGTAEASDFVPRELSAVAPANATGVFVSFLSHDGPQVVGCIGIDDVTVRREREGEEARSLRLVPPPDDAESTPRTLSTVWHRAGTRPEMSVVRIREKPSPHEILAFIDDDPSRYGNWVSTSRLFSDTRPGDRVTLTWSASHSLGIGGTSTATYHGLPPGSHWFRVGAFRPNGDATGIEASIPVLIVIPIHMRRDVWAVGAAGLAGAAVLVGRSLSAQRLKRRLDELERAHAVERERSRIARDLHDEIGAGLTEIAMQADAVRSEVQGVASPEATQLTAGICRTAIDLVRSVDAIVWAVNPANDTLDRFAAYLVQSTEQFLDAAGVSMRFDVPASLPSAPLAGADRHRLLMAVREALNNAVKHADAGIVMLSLHLADGRLQIDIEDDGVGFDPKQPLTGADHNGLANMRQRMNEIGGTFSITSAAGRGTLVRLTQPFVCTTPPRSQSHA